MVKMINYRKIINEMRNLYLNDKRPWIIGFSGGKDSTSVFQMVYYMLKNLTQDKRTKEVHILSSDTLVENPIIDFKRREICTKIERQAMKDDLPIKVKILRPELNDTFWVNLIGRGYPSPNRWFRWCTDRLKIKPMTKYIREQVKKNGEVIILLGARKDESGSRAQTMKKYEIKNFRLRKHSTIPGAYIYTPIEDWNFKDVWTYLLQVPSPVGDYNKELLVLYRKSNRECPLVIDLSTPPCGGSRFGCWVCTVVEKDISLEGFIEEGENWLEPLSEFRNWLKKIRNNPIFREELRKKDKKKKIFANMLGREFKHPEHRGHKILGPFTFEIRQEILRRLIELQKKVTNKGILLISPEEIKAIETIWIYEGSDISSFEEIISLSKKNANKSLVNSLYESELKEICNRYGISIQLLEKLLKVEKDFSSLSRRVGIYKRLEKVVEEYILNEAYKNLN